jgi:uncharacterized membrane protein YqhA
MAAMEDQGQALPAGQVRALRILFGLRLVMLVGSVGAFFGSLLMFYQGFLYLGDALSTLTGGQAGEDGVVQITVPILEAVDSFLFGVVLVIFAYGIVVGFLVVLPETVSRRLPTWMKIGGVGQLKQILAEVVVVVLIVIFARVVVESGGHFDWSMLVLPVAIVLLAGAIWLLELGSHDEAPSEHKAPHPTKETSA